LLNIPSEPEKPDQIAIQLPEEGLKGSIDYQKEKNDNYEAEE